MYVQCWLQPHNFYTDKSLEPFEVSVIVVYGQSHCVIVFTTGEKCETLGPCYSGYSLTV